LPKFIIDILNYIFENKPKAKRKHPNTGIETAMGQRKTTNNKEFGNHPRKGIETATGEGKTTNNKKFGKHPRNEI
jgi:hypothetical protein